MKLTLNKTLLAPALLIGGFALGSLAPHAQTAPQKVAFVNVADVLKAHPGNAAVEALAAKRDAEIKPIDDQVKALQAQGTAIKPADKDKLAQLIKTAQASYQNYQKQIDTQVTPIETSVDAAISTAAKANGVAIVMDKATAAQGLVVYADDTTDLTTAVKNALPKK